MPQLKNKTVIITRPKEQSAEFISKLEKLGAFPIQFPLIRLEPINEIKLVETYNSKKFDWIIFTSYNTIKTFFNVINPLEITSKIAVVGSKTQDALKRYNLSSDFIPTDFTAGTLANTIPIAKNNSIFIPQSAIAKSNLITILKNRRAKVTPLVTYQNTKIKYSQEELIELFNRKLDFITFTSGSTVKHFASLNINLAKTKVVCIGPETAKIAKICNIKVDAIANPYTIDGIINVLLELNNEQK